MKNDQSLIKIDDSELFYWYQLFIRYLIIDQNIDINKLKEEMIEQCRRELQNDHKELLKIDEFGKTCTLDTALNWYVRDSCIFRLVNKAFRTRNIHLICKFRYSIVLLYNQ